MRLPGLNPGPMRRIGMSYEISLFWCSSMVDRTGACSVDDLAGTCPSRPSFSLLRWSAASNIRVQKLSGLAENKQPRCRIRHSREIPPARQQRAFLASRVIPAARRHDCKTHQPMSQSSPASRHWRRASMQLTARCGTAMSLAMASSCAAIATHATVQNARIISLSSYTNTQLSFFATNSLLAKSMQLINTRTSALRRGFG